MKINKQIMMNKHNIHNQFNLKLINLNLLEKKINETKILLLR